jgi:hypothetical protein
MKKIDNPHSCTFAGSGRMRVKLETLILLETGGVSKFLFSGTETP